MPKLRELDLDIGWGISEEAFAFICSLIQRKQSQTLVEFGSGRSTIRWALEFTNLRVISIEHQRSSFEQVSQLIVKYGMENRIDLRFAPTRYRFMGARLYNTYELTGHFDEPCDIVVIDGPPHYTRRGREACLYYVHPSLNLGGYVILDDFFRTDEQAIVRNWLFSFPHSYQFSLQDSGHGLACLQKKETRRLGPKPSLRVLWDLYNVYCEELVRHTKCRIKQSLKRRRVG